MFVIQKSEEKADDMIETANKNKKLTAEKEVEVEEIRKLLYKELEKVGNLLHESVPVSNNEVILKLVSISHSFPEK